MNRVALPNPLWNTLTNYYTLDNTPNDVKGGANGTLINSLGYASAKINNGLNYNGINNYFTFPNSFFQVSNDFSISFWFNVNSASIFFLMDIGGGQTGYVDGFAIYRPAGSDLKLYVNGSNILSSGFFPSNNTWYHVGITHKTSTNYKMYINGSLANTLTTTKQISYPGTTISNLGTAQGGLYAVPLLMDEVSFFNSELTSTQMTELYNSGSGKQYPL
jgi:hypothetical protein